MAHRFPHSPNQKQPRGWRQSAVYAVVLAFTSIAICRAEEPRVEAPALPADVAPLPPELQDKMKVLIDAAQKYRGLKCKAGCPCGSLNEPMLKKKMLISFGQELPDAKMRLLESSLKAFGLIPETMDLAKYYPALLTSQVGGYYDPHQKYLVIVERAGGLLGKEARAQYGEKMTQRMEETVLVHELTHALQDQHFDLQKFANGDPFSDEAAAHLALVEGDATLTMYDYFMGMNIEKLPGLEGMIGMMVKDPKQMIDMSPDMPGAKEMTDAPAWFRDNMMFTYLQGFCFCVSVRKVGGQKLLDYCFSKDPPRSTEQILHPEKWHTNRDDPIEIVWPNLSKELPGYTKLKEGQLGEQSIHILLREALKNDTIAAEAAMGWGGDKFCVYEKDGKRVLAWITEWDTNKDAREFLAAARRMGADWQIEAPAPRRVTLVRSSAGAETVRLLQNGLAQAKSIMPENKNIDLAALHIAPPDEGAGAGAGADDLSIDKLAGLWNGLGGDDNKNGGIDPDTINKLKDMLGNGGDGGGEGKNGKNGKDIDDVINKIPGAGEMFKNPAVRSMLKGMMSQDRPAGALGEDGRTYTNAALGFSISAPSQPGWKVDPKPAIPLASVSISSPDGSVQIGVASQALPFSMDIDALAPFMEMAPKMALQNYKKVNSTAIKTGETKGLEMEYEGDNEMGVRIHAVQRVYLAAGGMLVISGICEATQWKRFEKSVKESLESFKFIAPGAKEKGKGKDNAKAPPPPQDEKEPLKEDNGN